MTTVEEEPYPGGAVVSRAPKTWMAGQVARLLRGEAKVLPARASIAAVSFILRWVELDP